MRWKYLIPSTTQERAEKERMLEKIRVWWKEFSEHEYAINDDIVAEGEWVNQRIRGIHPRLNWEFGPILGGGERLSITASMYMPEITPLAEEIVRMAPVSKRWQFFAYKPPCPLDYARRFFEAQNRRKCPDFQFSAELEGQGIELTMYASAGPDPEETRIDAFILAEYILGGDIAFRWLRSVRFEPLGILGSLFGKRGALPLEKMHAVVNGLKATAEAKRPITPFPDNAWPYSETDPVTGLSNAGAILALVQEERDIYPGWTDLYMGSSNHPELWIAQHTGSNFSSVRYSAFGEIYCYLKIDGSDGLNKDVEARAMISEPLHDRLDAKKLGVSTGGGMGTKYAYIELTLTDVDAAIPIILELAKELDLPRDSWLLFHDRELSGEWVGLREDTPAPPKELE